MEELELNAGERKDKREEGDFLLLRPEFSDKAVSVFSSLLFSSLFLGCLVQL